MAVLISLLRGVNVGGHHKIKMDALRALYAELGLRGVQTCGQSGNALFRTTIRDLAALRRRIEKGIEGTFGFHSDVVLRTVADLRAVVARNPFSDTPGIEPSRFAVLFLAADPGREARDKVLALDSAPEELRFRDRELYIYFPNGMARPKVSMALIEKTLNTSGTARNWNTVATVLEVAEKMEHS
ncbi:MAG: DUF1697 domain-containing protein [Bryobacteraceae bacterium]